MGSMPDHILCYTLDDIGITTIIPEPFDTIEENAQAKIDFIIPLTQYAIFAEDTGLEVNVLNGEPGVKSARYAGDDCNMTNNIDKLLTNLQGTQQRQAQFKTVICCYYKKQKHFFTGICKGIILEEQKGTNGFGYDAVFCPDGSTKSFGEMTLAEKKTFSHREKALQQFIQFLQQQ